MSDTVSFAVAGTKGASAALKLRLVRETKAVRGGETAATKYGREVHDELADRVRAKPGWQANPRLPGANGRIYVPGVVTPGGRIIDLKPDTPSGRAAGAAKRQVYEEQLSRSTRIIYYERPG